MQAFPDWLRASLSERGWSNGDLERVSGISNSIIWHWLSDRPRRPSPANLKKVAQALDASYEDLMRMCGYLPGPFATDGPDDADLAADKFAGALRGVPRRFWHSVVEASIALAKAYEDAPVEGTVSQSPVPPVRKSRAPANERPRNDSGPLRNSQRRPLALLGAT